MERVILLLAIILGVFFRVWQISEIPPGLAMDEAAFGYNAWSIATNLHDEYGKFMPTSFRSFADFKLPAYGYLTAIIVRLFGPGIWQTRAISVGSGLTSCLFLYLIIKRLVGRRLAVISGLIMLWSPWGVIFSRGAFESNLGLMFMLLGVYGLVRSRENIKFLVLTSLMFSLANYSYITYKFVTPVFFVIFLFFYRHRHKFSKEVLASCLVFVILSLPAFLMFLNTSGTNRINSLLRLSPQETGYPVVVQITASYLTYLSPKNLFFSPDPTKHRHFLGLSTFYSFLVIPWLIGWYILISKRGSELFGWVILPILVGQIPAILAADPYATLRAIPMLPAYCVLLAIGIDWLMNRLHKLGLTLITISILLASMQLYAALSVMKYNQSEEWNGGMDELVEKLSEYPERIVFVDILSDIYPNLAIALRLNPKVIQVIHKDFDVKHYYSDSSFPSIISFDRYQVGKIDKSEAGLVRQAILVTRPSTLFDNEPMSRGWKELFRVKDAMGRDLFLGFALN